jgi:hypothetical protein
MTSWKKPTPDFVSRAVAGMRHQQQQRYFFEKLNNPEWIEPLRKAKFFSTLPTVTRKEQTVTHYMWPASRYLARMAVYMPDLVAEIMSDFPETENPFVIQDILTAASAMPASAAARLVNVLAMSARSGRFVGMDRAGAIALNLAQNGQENAALTLLRSLLEVVPDPRPVTADPSGYVYRHEARTQIHGFDYGVLLRRYGQDLATALGGSFLEVLATKLDKALAQEYPKYSKAPRPVEDYSYIWQPDLEHSDMREEAKRLLLFGLVQATEGIVEDGHWRDAQKILDAHPFTAFQRIILFVLAKQPDLDLDFAANKLTDSALFHSLGVRQEFDELARAAFPKLSAEYQAAFLALIDTGPSKEHMVERGLSEQQIEQICRQWTLERIEPIREYLTPNRIKQVEVLEQEFGAAGRHQNTTVRGGAFARGEESPVSSDDIQAMSVDELLTYLKAWSPNRRANPFGPSHQGLARKLTAVIEMSPEKYIDRLHEFKMLQSTYVRAALQGLRGAARKGLTLAWRPLLELAEWICEQPAAAQTENSDNDWDGPDRGWHPARFAIVDMLEESFKMNALPVELGDSAWRLIDQLSDDRDSECVAYDNESSQEKDVWSYSLNTLRPRAVRVALNYMEWLYNNRLKNEGRLVDDVPQILAYLNRHLDPQLDKCLSVRLIYGEKFPFLHAHAPRWSTKAHSSIFPAQTDLQPLRDVAWTAYLVANRARTDLFALLESLYREAIHIPDDHRLQGKSRLVDQPSSLLAYHLTQLYWWGQIELLPNSVLNEFLNNANETALRSSIVYLGRSLSEASDVVSKEVISRLKNLWDYILNSAHVAESPGVFASFGWWFNTQYFDDEWALDHIQRGLRLSGGKFEPLLNALTRLAALVRAYPEAAFDSARMIALSADEYIDLWPNELQTILETALRAGDDNLSDRVREFINELGKRGRFSYRAMAEWPTSPPTG